MLIALIAVLLAGPAGAACPTTASLSAPWVEHSGDFPREAFDDHLYADLDATATVLLPVDTVSWWLGAARRGRGPEADLNCRVLGSAAIYANGPENDPTEDVDKVVRSGGEARLWPSLIELRWYDPKDGRKHRWFNLSLSKKLGWSTDGRGAPTDRPRPIPLPDAVNELL